MSRSSICGGEVAIEQAPAGPRHILTCSLVIVTIASQFQLAKSRSATETDSKSKHRAEHYWVRLQYKRHLFESIRLNSSFAMRQKRVTEARVGQVSNFLSSHLIVIRRLRYGLLLGPVFQHRFRDLLRHLVDRLPHHDHHHDFLEHHVPLAAAFQM